MREELKNPCAGPAKYFCPVDFFGLNRERTGRSQVPHPVFPGAVFVEAAAGGRCSASGFADFAGPVPGSRFKEKTVITRKERRYSWCDTASPRREEGYSERTETTETWIKISSSEPPREKRGCSGENCEVRE